jgi:hypothetical protein
MQTIDPAFLLPFSEIFEIQSLTEYWRGVFLEKQVFFIGNDLTSHISPTSL